MIKMAESNYGVVAIDYAVGEKNYSTVARKGDKILWCGLGCTLIKKEALDAVGEPWFRTDKSFKITGGDTLDFEEVNQPNKYGGHDIYFGLSLLKRGIPILKIPDMVSPHIKIVGWGQGGVNSGIHKFEIKDKIDNETVYK